MADAEANGAVHRLLRWLGRGGAALLALVTLTTATVGLLFTFVPGLKPEPEPSDRSAAITQVTIEPGATLRSYMTQIGQLEFVERRLGGGDNAAEFLRTPCISVYAQVRITGFEDIRKRLTFNLYDAAGGLPVSEFSYRPPTVPTPDELRAGFESFRAAQGLDFESRSESDQYVGRSCILSDAGTPPAAGRYFVRSELEDENGRLITYHDSDPFAFRPNP